ncbi:MAG: FHA domain-containing protein [Actinomycetia bacterium]|jgi:pSer/pThr/pTyr-binding forkhead associated (FHA) protein|nr:FHA domain-containing protein [Actinomycetes bacterium]
MVSDQLLLVLKLCLLALLYLFFFRVVRAVWAELRPLPQIPAGATTPPVAAPTRKRRKESSDAVPTRQLVVREPVELSGKAWALAGEVSIGRAAGCQVTIDDTYASQIHARIFNRDNQWQIEDLGSTNGTWLNRHKVAGPMVIKPGDVVQIGNTVMEMQ